MAQTHPSHAQPPQPGIGDVVHPAPVLLTHLPAWQVCPAGQPQSAGQVEQFSPWAASHIPFPQLAPPPHPPHWSLHSSTHRESQELLQQKGSMPHTQLWQAQPPHPGVGDVWHPGPVPPLMHCPNSQFWPGAQGQSGRQFPQFSPTSTWQTPSPHLGAALQVPFTQVWPAGQAQSPAQVAQFSPPSGSHRPSPQEVGPTHWPLSQTFPGEHGQSSTQLRQFSAMSQSHWPLPHRGWPPHSPHGSWHSWTHTESHSVLQQYGSIRQTHPSQAQPLHPACSSVEHPSSTATHAPFSHSSSAAHSPQEPLQPSSPQVLPVQSGVQSASAGPEYATARTIDAEINRERATRLMESSATSGWTVAPGRVTARAASEGSGRTHACQEAGWRMPPCPKHR